MADILLVTGRPGVGKTTLIRRLADLLGRRAGGFYTEEIREAGERAGFRLVTLDGRAATFAHVHWGRTMPHKVSRYGVDVTVLDRIGVRAVKTAANRRRVVVVDEIGKMELHSDAFRQAMDEIAAGPVLLVTTITLSFHPWAEAFKQRPGVTIHELTRSNRDQALDEVLTWLRARGVRIAAD